MFTQYDLYLYFYSLFFDATATTTFEKNLDLIFSYPAGKATLTFLHLHLMLVSVFFKVPCSS